MVILKTVLGYYICAGSLIGELYVLTAASCIFRYKDVEHPIKYSGIYVLVGTVFFNGNGIRRQIKHLDVFDQYKPGSQNNIGLVTVNNSIL